MKKARDEKKFFWYLDGRLLTDGEVEDELEWFQNLHKVEDKKDETK